MDVSSIASSASGLAAAKTQSEVSTTVLRKAMDIEQQSALTLLQALPQPSSNPAHLGNSVDVRA